MKRFISLLVVFAILAACCASAFAASEKAVFAANSLYKLGLFKGVGENPDGTPIFDLDRAPTRNEAVTMLVRLLGKETEAKSREWATPFTDLDDWVKPYVGYAYNNKLTNGISATEFGGALAVTASQYITFVLRALGYDSTKDFQYDKAWELSDKLGFTDGYYNSALPSFTRGDVAIISYSALDALKKGTSITLRESIFGRGELSAELKDLLDGYEAFIDKYCEFIKNYNLSVTSLLSKYMDIMTDFNQWKLKIDKLDTDSMSTADAEYYSEVMLRCAEKLSKTA